MALPVGSRTDWDDGDEPGGDEVWEICNDNGFVYKRRRPSYNDGGHLRSPPPSSSRACEAKTRRDRKKKTLLSLRDKYQKELDHWQQLSASLAQVPATATGPTEVPSTEGASSPAPSPSISLEIDELLLQVEAQEAILAKLSDLCDLVDAVCDAEEERMSKALINLPVWGSPRCLVAALTSL